MQSARLTTYEESMIRLLSTLVPPKPASPCWLMHRRVLCGTRLLVFVCPDRGLAGCTGTSLALHWLAESNPQGSRLKTQGPKGDSPLNHPSASSFCCYCCCCCCCYCCYC